MNWGANRVDNTTLASTTRIPIVLAVVVEKMPSSLQKQICYGLSPLMLEEEATAMIVACVLQLVFLDENSSMSNVYHGLYLT